MTQKGKDEEIEETHTVAGDIIWSLGICKRHHSPLEALFSNTE